MTRRLLVALGLGMLIGLERERTQDDEQAFAGARTFSLVALMGALSVYVAELSGLPWVFGLVFLAVLALRAISYLVSARRGEIGATTEASLIVTFLIGSLCAWDDAGFELPLPVEVGGGELRVEMTGGRGEIMVDHGVTVEIDPLGRVYAAEID